MITFLIAIAALGVLGAALMPRHQVEAIQRGESAEFEGRIWTSKDMPEIQASYAEERSIAEDARVEAKAGEKLKAANKRIGELETDVKTLTKRLIGERKPLPLKDGKPESTENAEQIGEHWYPLIPNPTN